MGQFEKLCTQKDVILDMQKSLEDSNPLNCGSKLNERLPRKVYLTIKSLINSGPNSHYGCSKSWSKEESREDSKISSYVLSSFTVKFYW